MKKLLSLFFTISLTLSACGAANTQPTPPEQTGTTAITSTVTQTPTITPLPTIPTFTPTFDVSTIVTVTPAEKAECPKENPSVTAKFATSNSDSFYETYTSAEILDYLNSGGTLDQLEKAPGSTKIVDLTGDGINEVVHRNIMSYVILGCKDGKYQDLLEFAPEIDAFSIQMETVSDLNRDRIPELIFYKFSHYGYAEIYIFEWDGSKFRSLIDVGIDEYTSAVIDYVSMTAEYKLLDMNEDGIREIVYEYDNNTLCDGFGGFCNGTPMRIQTNILSWNGKNYVNLKQNNYSQPQYRFQAIQDGDRQTNDKDYVEALSSYQAVIFDNDLEWWSPEREVYERYKYMAQFNPTPVASPTPIPDPAEYPSLAAYAYYRIILLHLVQGQEAEAASTYQTLQDTFGSNQFAAPYVEMATDFWESYQSTHKMYDGCRAAIQYAVEHPQIPTPLGSDYHGAQSHTYVPSDVCPFR